MNICYFKSPIGILKIIEDNEAIISINIVNEFRINQITELLKRTMIELDEYFSLQRKMFDIPIRIKGSQFQQLVYKELINIPYGETRSYLDIAKRLGNSKAFRAVGNANNKNPILILIPCHRVIGANKKLLGFKDGINVQKKLLDLEQR